MLNKEDLQEGQSYYKLIQFQLDKIRKKKIEIFQQFQNFAINLNLSLKLLTFYICQIIYQLLDYGQSTIYKCCQRIANNINYQKFLFFFFINSNYVQAVFYIFQLLNLANLIMDLVKKIVFLLMSVLALKARTITFSNYVWEVRNNVAKEGPGPNFFSNSNTSVWVDSNNSLHLTILKSSNKWLCSEVYLLASKGYGSYIFTVDKGFELLDPQSVLGLFTYLDDNHQIDIQISKWGYSNNNNTQFVVQPYNIAGNTWRFNLTNKNSPVVLAFTWKATSVYFQSFYANNINEVQKQIGKVSTSPKVYKQWNYTGKSIPKKSGELTHINFWLTDGKAPLNGKNQSIVIKQFKFLAV